MKVGRSLGVATGLFGAAICVPHAQAQVLPSDGANTTIIVPGGLIDRTGNGRGVEYRERVRPRAGSDTGAVTRDDNVLYPRAVVPPAAIGSPPVESGPDGNIQVITDTYRVTGTSFKDLWSSVQREAMSNGQAIGIGDATITFQPRAEFIETPEGCALQGVAVDLTAVLVFPEWDGAQGAAPRASEAFANMMNYLRVHEAQHVTIAREFRKTMVDAIEALPPAESCDVMRGSVREVAEEIDALHQARQRDYDTSERKMSAELFSRNR